MLRTLRPHGIDTLLRHERPAPGFARSEPGADGDAPLHLVGPVEEAGSERSVGAVSVQLGNVFQGVLVGLVAGALVELADDGHDDHRQQPEGDGADVPRHGDLVQPAAG